MGILYFLYLSATILQPSSSSFEEMAGFGTFVDKSHALQDFLNDSHPIHLLLRPRRSGKTTLLRMFRYDILTV